GNAFGQGRDRPGITCHSPLTTDHSQLTPHQTTDGLMYKLLLCLRYLRTRWIALASIVSVTLGVATMIVVNSVMAGFTREMQDRIKGILSDISFESKSLSGMPDPADHMRRIEAAAGPYIDSMTAGVHVPAMFSFEINGESINRPVQLVGCDPKTIGR